MYVIEKLLREVLLICKMLHTGFDPSVTHVTVKYQHEKYHAIDDIKYVQMLLSLKQECMSDTCHGLTFDNSRIPSQPVPHYFFVFVFFNEK